MMFSLALGEFALIFVALIALGAVGLTLLHSQAEKQAKNVLNNTGETWKVEDVSGEVRVRVRSSSGRELELTVYVVDDPLFDGLQSYFSGEEFSFAQRLPIPEHSWWDRPPFEQYLRVEPRFPSSDSIAI